MRFVNDFRLSDPSLSFYWFFICVTSLCRCFDLIKVIRAQSRGGLVSLCEFLFKGSKCSEEKKMLINLFQLNSLRKSTLTAAASKGLLVHRLRCGFLLV